MAKKKTTKRGVSKSEAIKDYLAIHLDASPKVAAEDLKTKGIDVTAAYVATIKSQQKAKLKSKTRRGSRKTAADTSPSEDVKHAGELMFQAVDLVMKAGLKEAKALVDMAGRMVDRVQEK